MGNNNNITPIPHKYEMFTLYLLENGNNESNDSHFKLEAEISTNLPT